MKINVNDYDFRLFLIKYDLNLCWLKCIIF